MPRSRMQQHRAEAQKSGIRSQIIKVTVLQVRRSQVDKCSWDEVARGLQRCRSYGPSRFPISGLRSGAERRPNPWQKSPCTGETRDVFHIEDHRFLSASCFFSSAWAWRSITVAPAITSSTKLQQLCPCILDHPDRSGQHTPRCTAAAQQQQRQQAPDRHDPRH